MARRHVDLENRQAVDAFFERDKPDTCSSSPPRLAAPCRLQNRVKKLLFLGSICIYPKHAPQPIGRPTNLTRSPRSPASRIFGAYNCQCGTNFISVIPSNLYAIGDNFRLANLACVAGANKEDARSQGARGGRSSDLGNGTPKKEFLYSCDFADACLYLMGRYDAADIGEFVNIGQVSMPPSRKWQPLLRTSWGLKVSSCTTKASQTARRESGWMSAACISWVDMPRRA